MTSGCIGSVIRLFYIKSAFGLTDLNSYGRILKFTIWSTVEIGLGIVAGSLATLRPLLRRFIDMSKHSSAQDASSTDVEEAMHLSQKSASTKTPEPNSRNGTQEDEQVDIHEMFER